MFTIFTLVKKPCKTVYSVTYIGEAMLCFEGNFLNVEAFRVSVKVSIFLYFLIR
jgi:hypothetical protein